MQCHGVSTGTFRKILYKENPHNFLTLREGIKWTATLKIILWASHFLKKYSTVRFLTVHTSPEFQWNLNMHYHSTFEITYSGFILGEFNFVIISAKIIVQNSGRNYFCNFPCFFQISVLPVAAATDSKPGWVEDPLFPQEKTQLRMATDQIRLLRWATGWKDNHLLQKN